MKILYCRKAFNKSEPIPNSWERRCELPVVLVKSIGSEIFRCSCDLDLVALL